MRMDPGIASFETKNAIRELYDDYAAVVDSLNLVQWTKFFTDDALYRVISRESYSQRLTHATIYCDGIGMIRDRVTMIDRVAVFEPRTIRHFISGVRIHSIEDDKIEATANFLVIESLFDAEPQLLMVGEYIDKIVRTEDGLRFQKRDAVYDQYRIRTTLVYPV
jgi:3-phenylpropionate/cinnamic acid dioxygenase small subunit